MWRWLAQNKDAIGSLTAIVAVVVATAAVAVAWIYASLTRRLADTARDQIALTKEIATETRRQATETHRQAQISQQVFEASHRPFLEVDLDRGDFVDEERFVFVFTLKNHGSIPAVNVQSTVICLVNERVVVERPSRVPHVLFPGEARNFRVASKGGFTVQPPPPGTRVEATVEYGSTAGREYFTKFFFECEGPEWRMTREEIGEVPRS